MAEEPPRLPFQRSAETRLLIALLRTATIGKNYTYTELARVVGKPVDGSFVPLITARRFLQKEYDLVFGIRPGIGLWRLSDEEIVDSAPNLRARIRRACRRAFDRLSKAEFSKLPVAYQLRFSAEASVAALIAYETSPRQVRQLESAMPEGKRQLPIAETLAMFIRKAGPDGGE